jgi:hypothetical protein
MRTSRAKRDVELQSRPECTKAGEEGLALLA